MHKLEILHTAVASYFTHCNSARLRRNLRITSLMAANMTDRIWLPEALVQQTSRQEAEMAYYLIHRFGPKDKPQFRKEEFSMEPEAVTKAHALLAAGDRGEFVIEDDNGKIILNDQEVRDFCKTTQMH
jgi:hypothetical protein